MHIILTRTYALVSTTLMVSDFHNFCVFWINVIFDHDMNLNIVRRLVLGYCKLSFEIAKSKFGKKA